MRILFWVPYPTEGASNRYRVEQYLPYLASHGIRYSMHPFWTTAGYRILYKPGNLIKKVWFFFIGTVSRLMDLLAIFRYDLVFIHREAYPIGGARFENILAFLKKPFIFDFDDALFLSSTSPHNNFTERFKRPEKIPVIIEKSAHVIAGNRYLEKFALQYNRATTMIPTSVDTRKYFHSAKGDTPRVTIGWIGSVTTSNFLNIVEGALIKVSGRYGSGVSFRFIGGGFQLDGIPNMMVREWSMASEKADLEAFDIGIMPMADTEWSKGKCGFKAILYMSMGIPCVCSAVGANNDIVADGVNGFLVRTEDEWVDRLSKLIEDASLRKRMGGAGRRTAEELYSVDVNAPRILAVINEVSEGRKK